ncbi:hypothetical protein LTR85_002774 [Meristemomyces frigidus]|nr:hypothetical protein LTR85_002774 [Meristemomyces frigidus]
MLLRSCRRACVPVRGCPNPFLRRNHASPAPERRLRSKRTGDDNYTVLAIETSCDDTSVAIVGVKDAGFLDSGFFKPNRKEHKRLGLDVYFHEKITANNDAYTGIHPLVALESHRASLAPLLQRALGHMKRRHAEQDGRKLWEDYEDEDYHDGLDNNEPVPVPEFVAVTRGPGMRSNLAVGLDTAKGLATAWGVPLIGVHHMQAHALTPRLLTAQANWLPWVKDDGQSDSCRSHDELEPAFPFLTVLVSGGHTMLIDSKGLTEHTTLAETQDIAIGDFLDKAARAIMPGQMLRPPFGAALERFAFHSEVIQPGIVLDDDVEIEGEARGPACEEHVQPRECRYDYTPPARRQDELETRPTGWGWALTPPLAESKGGEKSSRRMVYSFAGLLTSIERLAKRQEHISLVERQVMAREVQRVAFEHLASRILLHLSSASEDWKGDTIVVSGGVASNKFLRHLLRSVLDARGYSHVKLSFPPIELCTDNALMIAWAGIEMYEAGYTSSLDIGPIRTWSMDPKAPDGGILGVGGWLKDDKPISEG